MLGGQGPSDFGLEKQQTGAVTPSVGHYKGFNVPCSIGGTADPPLAGLAETDDGLIAAVRYGPARQASEAAVGDP